MNRPERPMRPLEPAGSISDRLRIQAAYCGQIGSPLYADLLERAAADFEAGGPTVGVLRGHEYDAADTMLALRLMGAVNRIVLRGEEPTLACLYADPNRDPEATWDAFRGVVNRHSQDLAHLVELPVQTNEVGRCAALLPGFLAVVAETRLPLRLLEIGASAGLNLRWDRYRYVAEGFEWGPTDPPVTLDFQLRNADRLDSSLAIEVAERHGCDAAPVDPTTPEGRETLLAYVWPDQAARVERLRAAIKLAAEMPVDVDRSGAAAWIEQQLGTAAPGRVTVVYHSIVTQYLSQTEREAFRAHLDAAANSATAEAPLAWLRMEPADGMAAVTLTIWPGGDDRLIARAGYHGSPVEL